MENASKALIIAGAILLSILLISLGIIVVNNTRTTIDKANVDQTAAETFNSKFEAYFGTKRTGSEARALMSAVKSTGTATSEHKVELDAGGKTSITDIEYSKTYKIEESERKDGYITKIKVTQNET